jgi:hypothetical protein
VDTLKNDLERAIPRFDTTSNGMAALTRDGRRALRRRRARVAAVLTTGGLAVAGVAMGATVMFAEGGQQDTNGATAGGATSAPRTATSSQPVEADLSLASLQQVADACGPFTLDTASKTLTNDGQIVDASDEAHGDGWSAAQYACGSDILRIVQADDRGLVGRYPASEDESLSAWAQDNVGRLRQ